MKKILPLIIIVAILAITAVIVVSLAKKEQPITIVKGNMEMKPLDVKVDFTNDTQCKMIIKERENSSQVVKPDGKTWFFDDPSCMVAWLQEKPFKEQVKIWIYTLDTKRWIEAQKAWYGVTDKTAMHSGFGARENPCPQCINFNEMSLRTLRGETFADPKIRKKLLEQ